MKTKTKTTKATNNISKNGCLMFSLKALLILALSSIIWIPLVIYIAVKVYQKKPFKKWLIPVTALSFFLMIGGLVSGGNPDTNETSSAVISTEESSSTETIEESCSEETTEIIEESCSEETTESSSIECDYVLNINTLKFHYPDCSLLSRLKDEYKDYYSGDIMELIEQGYAPCEICDSDSAIPETSTTEEVEETLPAETTIEPTTVAPTTQAPTEAVHTYVLNTSSRKFHYSDCRHVNTIKPENREDFIGTRQEVINKKYQSCGTCNP